MPAKLKQLRSKVRDFALALPEVTEDFPWGERVAKVNKKVFAFLGRDMDAHFSLGVKLKASHAAALSTPGAAPMRYGLGKSGWVGAKFEEHAPPFQQLRAWVLESYAAVAPKKLAAHVTDERAAAPRVGAKKARAAGAPKKPSKVAEGARATRGANKPAAKSKVEAKRAAPGKSKSVGLGVRAGKRAPKR